MMMMMMMVMMMMMMVRDGVGVRERGTLAGRRRCCPAMMDVSDDGGV